MARLDIDVLELIINRVDNAHTLFSLLTVSRQVFRYACRTLYRDPGFYLERRLAMSEIATMRLAKLILAISPAYDGLTDAMRQIFDVRPAHRLPMLDYLSFIRVVRWGSQMGDCIQQIQSYSQIDLSLSLMKTGMLMAACSHQLGNLVEIEVQASTAEHYIPLAPELTSLKRVFFASSDGVETEENYFLLMRFVHAFQLLHGQDALQECRFAVSNDRSSFTAPHPLQLELEMMFPIPALLKNVKVVSPQPMDRFWARQKLLFIDSASTWHDISRFYPHPTLGRILQCCRKLSYLEISLAGDIVDVDLFAWAAKEALDRAAGKPAPPLVPLETLRLSIPGMKPRDAAIMMQDVFVGFALSLRDIKVTVEPEAQGREDGGEVSPNNKASPTSDYDDADLALLSIQTMSKSVVLPKLDSISILIPNLGLLYPRLLQSCRNLRTLTLKQSDSSCAVTPMWTWPSVLPYNLTTMLLNGAAANLFDPAALWNLIHLETLDLEQACEDPTPERSLRMKRWTWNWFLPQLKYLTVQSRIEEWFSLKILRTCPSLQIVTISSACKDMLDVGMVLYDRRRDSFNSVQQISITGKYDITASDLVYLLHRVLPSVKQVKLGNIASCTDRQFLVATYCHPTLRHVYLEFYPLAELKTLGLRELKGDPEEDACVYHIGICRPKKYVWLDEQ